MPFFGNYREESKLVPLVHINHGLLIKATEFFHCLLQGVVKFFAHLQETYGSVVGYIT